MVTYKTHKTLIAVFVDGKRTGVILEKKEGWVYFPDGAKGHHEPTIFLQQCKDAIEADN